MINKFYILVNDSDNMSFESKQLSNQEFASMLDEYMNTHKESSYVYGTHNNLYKNLDEIKDVEYKFSEKEFEALVLDSNKKEFNEEKFYQLYEEGKNFVVILNVNPESIDFDAESEIKYWLDDSLAIWEDEKLDKKTKLLSSPTRELKIVLSDGNKYTLNNCKIFEDYSTDKYPIYFAMFVEKITK